MRILLFEEWYNSANLDNLKSREGSFHNGFLCSYPKESFWLRMCIDISMNATYVKEKKEVWRVSGTNKLRNEFVKNNSAIFYCKHYVVCPFICKANNNYHKNNTNEIIHEKEEKESTILLCVSKNNTPLSLKDSSWSFFSFEYVKKHLYHFNNSLATCVFLNSGSLWMNQSV